MAEKKAGTKDVTKNETAQETEEELDLWGPVDPGPATLEMLRKEMDRTDRQLLLLIEERMDLSRKIAEVKYHENMPIRDKKRELEVLERYRLALRNTEIWAEIKKIVIQILAISRHEQRKVMEIAKRDEKMLEVGRRRVKFLDYTLEQEAITKAERNHRKEEFLAEQKELDKALRRARGDD